MDKNLEKLFFSSLGIQPDTEVKLLSTKLGTTNMVD